jgi:gluconolactonase
MGHNGSASQFESLIDPAAKLEQLATGFEFTEGPIWHPVARHLLFSDMPGDVRRRWDVQGGVIVVKRPANKCNGMTYDRDLNLIVCEHATSSIVRETPDGRREVLASHFEGKELNSPNDVCIHSSGAIYFSDPWYGRMPVFGVERPRELGFQGVYRIDPVSGALQLLVDKTLFGQPNGLCFSPDESLLYINDTENALIRVFDVQPDGSLTNGRIFASGIQSSDAPGAPDGMKCDERGNIWVTAPGGLWVYSPQGALLGKLATPEMVGNLAWGGDDFHELFIMASHSVYRIRTRVGPRVEPFMRAVPARKQDFRPEHLQLDPRRCALILLDVQNDVVSEGGAFAAGGAAEHAHRQNLVANLRRLTDAARSAGVVVVHVRFVVEPNAPGLTLNAPLFEGIVATGAVVRGTWGAVPPQELEAQPGDFVVEKMRMSAWEGTSLETILKATGRDVLINTGAWTNMSVEHTSRTAADKGYRVVVPQDCCSSLSQAWHAFSVENALPNVATVVNADQVIAAWH